MRLKSHHAAAALHSQLSTILEKLMILAVEEMKELVFDFFEEISRERASKSTDLSQIAGQDLDDRAMDSSDSFYIEPQDASTDAYEQMTPTSSRDEAKETRSGEQNFRKMPATDDFAVSVQETLSPNFKFEQAATSCGNPREDDCSLDESKQDVPGFEPAEDSKDHFIDYKSPDEAQSAPYEDFSPSQGHSRDVECHIKQEEETPAFETGRNTDDIHSHTEQGMNFDSFNERSEETHSIPPLEDAVPRPNLDIFPFAFPDQPMNAYASGQENQFPSLPELRLPPSKLVKKYACDFCHKKFCYPSDLKHHRLWHTRERTHVCQICGKAFITRSHLRRHEVMHLDVQPSVCQICGYKTSRMVYLKEHMKTHAKKTAV